MSFDSAANEELNMYREMIQRFMAQEIEPHYEQWEKDKLIPREFWLTMGQAGILCVDMPEEYGAAGASFEVCQLLQEEMCRGGYHGLVSGYGMHGNIIAPYTNNLGNDEQKAYWLPKMISGEAIGGIGMTEPGAGSDLGAMRTSAVRDGDEWVINGSKVFITNGIHADVMIVCAKTNPDAGAKGISLFLVDTSLPGYSTGKKIDKMGQHCNDTAELFFDNLRLPADALLGEENKGFIHLMDELPRERLGVAVQAIGHAQGALDLAAEYTQERKVFGQPVSKLQNTRFKLGELKAELELCRAYLEKCMSKFSRGEMTVEDAATLKLTATEMQLRMVNECLQLFGGYGYTDEYAISRFYRDARVQTIYAGSSEIMKEVIARGVVGR